MDSSCQRDRRRSGVTLVSLPRRNEIDAAAGVNHWEPPVRVNRFNTRTGTIDVSDEVPEAGGQDMAIGPDSVWFLKDGEVLRFRLSP